MKRDDQAICEHQTPRERPNSFKCALGLYGGFPYLGNCLNCVKLNENNQQHAQDVIARFSRSHPAGASPVSGCCDSALNPVSDVSVKTDNEPFAQIVIPLHHRGGKLRNDTELRYALRSLEKHFKSPFKVAIVGKKIPDWIQGVEHVSSDKGLKKALLDAADRFPEGFFWWYDDQCLLLDTNAEQMRITPACKCWSGASTGWSRKLARIRERLELEGYKAWDYSRPHGPYWFNKEMIDEAFSDWPGMSGKFPFESWILSKRDWPRQHGCVKQYYGPFRNPPGDGSRYLNYNDSGNTPQLRSFLSGLFQTPSKYESKEEGFFFIHVPKTAGKSLLAAAGDLVKVESVDRHLPWSDSRVRRAWTSSGRLPVVACVRNPVDRAVSAYRYFLSRDFPEKDAPHRVLKAMFQVMTFSDFWEKSDVASIATVIKHLRPQSEFLDGAPIDVLMRYEALQEDIGILFNRFEIKKDLPFMNVSKVAVPNVSPLALSKIRNFYEKDFLLYYPEELQKS